MKAEPVARRSSPVLLPAAVGAACFALVYLWIAVTSLQVTGFTAVYPLDDTYTQMAIARTLVASGTYGFVPEIMAFSSSSLLWVVALALGALAGTLDAAPALLNISAALLLLVTSLRYLARQGFSRGWLTVAAIGLNVIVPLGATAAIGLEHTAHAWVTIAFATLVAAGPAIGTQRRTIYVWAAVLAGLRFEGLFLVACAAVIVSRRRLSMAIGLVAASCVPLALHAVFALSHGWPALPAPLVVKGHYPADASAGAVVAAALQRLGRLSEVWSAAGRFDVSALVLVAAASAAGVAWAFARGERESARLQLSVLFLGTLAMHAAVAKLDPHFGRYGMYLIALGFVAALPWVREAAGALFARGTSTRRYARQACAAALIAFCGLSVFAARRTARLTLKVPAGSREMYLQQYQMGTFARQAFPGQTVAINDLGLVTYRGGVRPFDLIGLGTIEIARLYRGGRLTPDAIDTLARDQGVVAAMIYPDWIANLAGGVPLSWIPIADLSMATARVAGYPSVRLYALERTAVAEITSALRAFEPTLPAGAWVTWLDSEPQQTGAVEQESRR